MKKLKCGLGLSDGVTRPISPFPAFALFQVYSTLFQVYSKMATVSKYNLTLNGITATLVLDSKPDEHGRIDWTLELMSDGNKTTTSSKLTINPKQDLPPKPDESVQRQTAETEWPDNDGAKKAMNEARELAAANAP